jgi:hypothetical protein
MTSDMLKKCWEPIVIIAPSGLGVSLFLAWGLITLTLRSLVRHLVRKRQQLVNLLWVRPEGCLT